ncbi:CSG1/SUR1-like protein [Savitreella phatthalungensis]
MRRSVGIFILCQALILGSLVYSVRWLLVLLVDTGASDAIKSFEIPGVNSTNDHDIGTQRIPKIIHQTWKNETIPEIWREPQQTCLDLHTPANGYEYKLWTDASSRDFIAREYTWFLDTFDKYAYNIQRADAIRYFILLHYGGIYIDLDDGCARSLDPLLTYGAFVRKTRPTGISNDIMGAVPGHPFFRAAVEQLKPMRRSWHMPYLTVMASTGPLFLSLVWLWYKRQPYADAERDVVRILWADEYMGKPWSFFLHYQGSSWHDGDSGLFFWMKRHWVALFVLGWVIGLSAIAGLWLLSQRLQQQRRLRRRRLSSTNPTSQAYDAEASAFFTSDRDGRGSYEKLDTASSSSTAAPPSSSGSHSPTTGSAVAAFRDYFTHRPDDYQHLKAVESGEMLSRRHTPSGLLHTTSTHPPARSPSPSPAAIINAGAHMLWQPVARAAAFARSSLDRQRL